jgi:GT2 family glycosyltransferase
MGGVFKRPRRVWLKKLKAGGIKMEASIIVVNYNSKPYLQSCLTSLQANTDRSREIIIVDNYSTDDSKIFLKTINQPGIRVIMNESNRGYAAACNQGIAAAHGRVIVTMNPDVLVPPGWLSRLIWHLNRHRDALAIGPKGLGIGGRQAPLPLSYSSKFEAAARKFAAVYHRQSEPVKCLIGCLFLFDRRLIQEVGYFDEQLPLGADDFDISLRVRQAGFELRVAWDVLIKHFAHVSFRAGNPETCRRLETDSYNHFKQKWAQELEEFGWQRLLEDNSPVFPHETEFVPNLQS